MFLAMNATFPSIEVLKNYLVLAKPKIGLMVLVCSATGFFLAKGTFFPLELLTFTLFGTFLTVSGSTTLNNFLERDLDSLMERTRKRPLPSGKITPASALSYGTILVLAGVGILVAEVNLLTGFLALLSTFLYV